MKNEVSQSGSELVPSDIRPLINEISGAQVMIEPLKKGDKKEGPANRAAVSKRLRHIALL